MYFSANEEGRESAHVNEWKDANWGLGGVVKISGESDGIDYLGLTKELAISWLRLDMIKDKDIC